MRVKEESVKAGLNLNIQKMKIMASSSVTSWQIEGQKVDAATDFLFLGSEIIVDSDCSHEIKRHLLLGRKTILDKNENAYYLDKTRNVKAPCVCTCTVLACDPWKGQRAQRAGLLLALL